MGSPVPGESSPQHCLAPGSALPPSRPDTQTAPDKNSGNELFSPEGRAAELQPVLELGSEAGTLGKRSWAGKAAARQAAPLLTGGSSRCLDRKVPGTPGHWLAPELRGSPGPKGKRRLLLSDSGAP